ncbi:predicted protein, partial [Nematostella vectensis]
IPQCLSKYTFHSPMFIRIHLPFPNVHEHALAIPQCSLAQLATPQSHTCHSPMFITHTCHSPMFMSTHLPFPNVHEHTLAIPQ